VIRLGINVDHVASVRQARRILIPDPVEAALLAEKGGAEGITVHLREDRRHVQERDVELLRQKIHTKLNLEMAATQEMVRLAEKFRPNDVCIVPERREELTTEGGLDVLIHRAKVQEAVKRLQGEGIQVSLFVDPESSQIEMSREIGARVVELHTGRYCNVVGDQSKELEEVVAAASLAQRLGLEVHGGHGLNYKNVFPIARIPEMVELNIGHSIVARSIMVGMEQAVREMKEIMHRARES